MRPPPPDRPTSNLPYHVPYFRAGIVALGAALVLAVGGCNERTCEEVPTTGFGEPTSIAFSSDGTRLFVVSANGNRRFCQAFLSVLNVGDGNPGALSWVKQVPLPGLPGEIRLSSGPDQILVPALLDGDGTISGKLMVFRSDFTLLQEIQISRGPFWATLDPSSGPTPRLLLSSLPDQRVDLLKSNAGTWELEETFSINSVLFRSGPTNLGASGLPFPERSLLYHSSDRSWLLLVDSAYYAFPLDDERTTPRSLLWIAPLDQRDRLYYGFVGLKPRSMAVDETRAIAYVTNLGGSGARGDVSLVDLTLPTGDSRTFFTLDLDPTLSAPQGVVPAEGSTPYELLLVDGGSTLFVTDLRAPRVYEIDLTEFQNSLRGTAAAGLRPWAEGTSERGENPADYFPPARVHSFPGRGAAFLAYNATSRRLAVSDPAGNRIWLYSRATEESAIFP